VVTTPFSMKLLVVLIGVIVIVAAFFVVNAEYQRKTRVQGFLSPSEGVFRIKPAIAGHIHKLLVKEGQKIKQDQALLEVVSKHLIDANTNANQSQLNEMLQQKQFVQQDRRLLIQQQQLLMLELQKKQSSLQQSLSQMTEQKTILISRLKLKRVAFQEYAELSDQGHTSKRELRSYEDEILALEQQLSALKASQISLRHELEAIVLELEIKPKQHHREINQLKQKASQLSLRIAEHRLKLSHQVLAPKTGTVTNLLVKQGDYIDVNQPLMTVLPENSQLQAELFVLSSEFGNIETGHQVSLRYAAFPYQKFGSFKGVVSQVGQSVLLPDELPANMHIENAVYKVVVKIDSQYVQTTHNQIRLRSGMTLEADILLGSSSFASKLFEPLISWKGRLSD